MAYAWYPEPDRLELRYVASPAGRRRLRFGAATPNEPVPSLADVAPLLSWYEREITDLFGLRFHRSSAAASPGAARGRRSRMPPFDPDYPPDRPLRFARETRQPFRKSPARRPMCSCCRSARSAATCWSRREFLFFYIGEAILHYHPRLFFKHRGMEKRFEGLDAGARGRAGGTRLRRRQRGACAGLLSGGRSRVAVASFRRARDVLRVLLAEMERLYNHLHYFGHLCHTTTLKVGEAEGKLLEEHAKQLNARLTGSRFLRSMLAPRRAAARLVAEGLARRRARSAARAVFALRASTWKIPQAISIA